MENEVNLKGFHKAKDSRAREIRKLGNFPISTDPNMWLGDGVYFWITMEDAEWWNEKQYKHSYIFSADLVCNSDHYADLDSPEEMAEFEEFASDCDAVLRKAKKRLSVKERTEFRAYMCNYYKKRRGILLMKFSFPVKTTNILGFEYASVRPQVCATNNTIIHNIKQEKEMGDST